MRFPSQVHESVGFQSRPERPDRPARPAAPTRPERPSTFRPLVVRDAGLQGLQVPPPPVVAAPARSRRGGWMLATALVAAGVTALAVSSAYESRSLGERLDDSLGAVTQLGDDAQQRLSATADAAVATSAQAVQSVDTAIDDAAIHARIVAALVADPALPSSRIDVDVNAGTVRLHGVAPTAADKERASSLALATDGVRRVDNRLVVAAQTVATR